MKPQRKFNLQLILIFAVLSILFLLLKNPLAKLGIDNGVLLIANTILFAISMCVFIIQHKALQNSNPNVFIRSIMAGMMIKMAVCAISVIVYVIMSGKNLNRIALLIFFVLYFVYLIAEVAAIRKLNNQINAKTGSPATPA